MTGRKTKSARNKWLVVRGSDIQGRGAFAIRRIPKGTVIVEYTGERISHAEADRRYDEETTSRHHTFLFIVDSKWVVDAAHGGNGARFINHSCAPNSETFVKKGRVYIEAISDIYPGEEVAYDYMYDREGIPNEDALYPCHCGAAECRGTILVPPKRPKKSAKRKLL